MSESASGEAGSGSAPSDKDSSVDCPSCGKAYSSRHGLRYHMRDCCPWEMEECPTCGVLYQTDTGVKQHHIRSHGESLCFETFECENCGVEFEERDSERRHDGVFCSHECYIDFYRGDWFLESETVEYVCHGCGKHCERDIGEVKDESENLFCNRECYLAWNRGENHPLYEDGERQYYGPNWLQQRRKALIRDQGRCHICRKTPRDVGRELDVHHIVRLKWFVDKFDEPECYEKANELSNLVTYCPSCHNTWEGIPVKPLPKKVSFSNDE